MLLRVSPHPILTLVGPEPWAHDEMRPLALRTGPQREGDPSIAPRSPRYEPQIASELYSGQERRQHRVPEVPFPHSTQHVLSNHVELCVSNKN